MLILYVNEVPDRSSDARAGKRTLPVRLSQAGVISGYTLAALAAFAAIGGGVLLGLLPIPTLIALTPLPLIFRVREGLARYYEQPYGLMAVMAVNIRVHLYVGVLLFGAYVASLLLADRGAWSAALRALSVTPAALRREDTQAGRNSGQWGT